MVLKKSGKKFRHKNGQKLSKLVNNSQKQSVWSKLVKKGQKQLTTVKKSLSNTVIHDQKWFKIVKNGKTFKNVQQRSKQSKLSKTVKNRQQ